MKRMILVCMFVLAWFFVFGTQSANAQTQEINITRELRVGGDTKTNTWSYNWFIKVKCAGPPAKTFDITLNQYYDLYSDAVEKAINGGKVGERLPPITRIRKTGTLITEMLTISTTFQGQCVMP